MVPTIPRLTLAAAAFALAGAAFGQAQTAPAPAPATKSMPATAPAGTPSAGATGAAPSTGGTQPPAPRSASPKAGRQKGDLPVGRELQNAYSDLMTPEEMAAHRTKVKSIKTYSDCKTLFETTNKEMEARAKALSKAVKSSPTEICDRAKERGRVTG